jgi:hypothetical protein
MWLYAAGIGQSLRHWGHQPCQSNSITHFDLGTGRVMILHVEWSPEYRYMFAYIIIQTRMMLCKHISTSIPTHKHILTYVHIFNILSSSPPQTKKTSPNLGIVHRPITCWLGRPVCMLSHAWCCGSKTEKMTYYILKITNIYKHGFVQEYPATGYHQNPGTPKSDALEPHSSHQNCSG